MATAKPTQPRTSTVPQPGSRPSVRVDAEMSDDLAVLMCTGADYAAAVRDAVGQVAEMYRTAWAQGTAPEGTTPYLIAYQFGPRPTDAPAPTRPYDGTSDRSPIPRIGRSMNGPHPTQRPRP